MVNLRLAYDELQSTTKKPFKEVKRTVDSIYKNRPSINYQTLVNIAYTQLREDSKNELELDAALKAMANWSRSW